MAKNIKTLAKLLGAEVVGEVPEVGGGAFGMSRLAHIMHQRLTPSRGERPGRPAVAGWKVRSKVPMSRATHSKLKKLARKASTSSRKISAMQLAAQLLEEAVARIDDAG